MPDIEVDGNRLHYLEVEGEGPSILMLCSTGLDSRQWRDMLPLVEGRRIICPHYLCYPKSGQWAGDGEIDSWVDYLAAESLLLAEQEPVDILGHSYGGFIGLMLAKRHPDKVRRMSFHEPTVWGCLQSTGRDDLKNEFGEVVETFFTEGLEPEDFLRDFVDIHVPTLITLSDETPPHQFEACTLLSRALPDVRVRYVRGGHMGVITRSSEVMPLLADWLMN